MMSNKQVIEGNLVAISDFPEFDNHNFIAYIQDDSGLTGFIAIHRKNAENPSFGATRLWKYENEVEALRDALRLSRLMSYKAALAGLPCGGAKGVIIEKKQKSLNKAKLFEAYTESVNSLNGNFITGADVGISEKDVKQMRKNSPYIVGLNKNVVQDTALGIFYSIEVVLKILYGSESIKGKTFAIQGLGKVGESLLNFLKKDAKLVYVSDVDQEKIRKISKKYNNVEVVDINKIHEKKVDIFSPCALGNSLNSKTVVSLNCKAIVGGANNQLESEDIGKLIHKLGIIYAPDYVVNAGGLINVYDEHILGKHDPKRVREKILNIKDILNKILIESLDRKRASNIIANKFAEKIFNDYN